MGFSVNIHEVDVGCVGLKDGQELMGCFKGDVGGDVGPFFAIGVELPLLVPGFDVQAQEGPLGFDVKGVSGVGMGDRQENVIWGGDRDTGRQGGMG